MSRLSISNIAWPVEADIEVSNFLRKLDVEHIDLAPTKYFADLEQVTKADWLSLRRFWTARGFKIIGFQSLLFGTKGLNIFTTPDERMNTMRHLTLVAEIANRLGATKLVFGSPKNRDRGEMADIDVESISTDFFWNLGEIGRSHGVEFCLEPNPEAYGCNFMTTSAETAQVVTGVNHPNLMMQFDTGSLEMNEEVPLEVANEVKEIVGHVHLSSENLQPAFRTQLDRESLVAALEVLASVPFVTIEQKDTHHTENLRNIEKAVQFARVLGVVS